MYKLYDMKDKLICAVEKEICNLDHADCKELGEAIDMIKDLEEAIYYCTITEAMKENGNGNGYHHANGNDNGHHLNGEIMPIHSYEEDMYCGNSYKNRKMYMEAKAMKKDKAIQLRELEKYIQELTNDIVDMIQDSSPEEKQYVEKKINLLASKISSMK